MNFFIQGTDISGNNKMDVSNLERSYGSPISSFIIGANYPCGMVAEP